MASRSTHSVGLKHVKTHSNVWCNTMPYIYLRSPLVWLRRRYLDWEKHLWCVWFIPAVIKAWHVYSRLLPGITWRLALYPPIWTPISLRTSPVSTPLAGSTQDPVTAARQFLIIASWLGNLCRTVLRRSNVINRHIDLSAGVKSDIARPFVFGNRSERGKGDWRLKCDTAIFPNRTRKTHSENDNKLDWVYVECPWKHLMKNSRFLKWLCSVISLVITGRKRIIKKRVIYERYAGRHLEKGCTRLNKGISFN